MAGPAEMWTVTPERARAVPWRNGRGTTRELFRVPDRDAWQWRLAIASSACAAPFSAFPGVDRELLLVRGAALELRFRTGRTTRLTVGERTRFAGDEAATGVPIAGATEQLNLMWLRSQADFETDVVDVDPQRSVEIRSATWLVLHVVRGSMHHPSGAGRLRVGSTVVMRDAQPVRLDGDATVFVARLTYAPGASALTGAKPRD